MSFHSTHATSHALQPMQVVTSMYLQTSSSRCTPSPGAAPVWPELNLICSLPVGMDQLLFNGAGAPPPARTDADARRRLSMASGSHGRRRYTFSIFTMKPLNSGVYAFGS